MTDRWRNRAVLVGFWLVPAAVATLAFQFVPSRYNPGLGVAGIFLSQAAIWLAWGLWSLGIVGLAERFPFERGRIATAFAVHVPFCAFVTIAQILVIDGVSQFFTLTVHPPLHLASIIAYGMRNNGDSHVVIYCAVVGAHAALRWHERWREESLRTARLGEDLASARLQALRAQLNPHFLFNALNAVVSLVDRDPPAAQRMTVRLADLLRATLAAGDAQETSLRQELELTSRYLEIEQMRFADRLAVAWSVPPGLDEARLPSFTLQPLVENAIRHGITRRTGGGRVEIAATRVDDDLVLSVSDDGAGLAADAVPAVSAVRPGAGIALANLRARLERLYGARGVLELVPRDGGGAVARVRVPLLDVRAASPR